MTVQQDIQRFSVGEEVELFELDLTPLGVPDVRRFCSSLKNSAAVTWQGNVYEPIPVTAEGFEQNGRGQLPQPQLKIVDTTGAIGALVRTYGDLLGATVTRIRTLGKYLDGAPEADPTAEFPREVFRIERKSGQSRFQLEFTLASAMDLRGLKLPRRLVLKNTCTFIYRRYVDGGFVYDGTENACPYQGAASFDALGNAVADDLDVCGKKLSDCKIRYPQPASVPFRGFPGVYDVRI